MQEIINKWDVLFSSYIISQATLSNNFMNQN